VTFYICCESFKLCLQEELPELEEMSPAELGMLQWPDVKVSNIYFDVTPTRLITGWCTERGAPDTEIGDKN
jgi:translation initiation factor eIF-2B subunit delta